MSGCKCWKHQKGTEDYDAVAFTEKKRQDEEFVDELQDGLKDVCDHEARLALIRKLYWAVFGTRLLTRVLNV